MRFGEGEQLGKFHFGNPSANISIPQGGKEYAVANVNVGTDVARNVSTNEMPVNFKATKNGEYTISVNPENVELDYLHLIDNLKGTDIDLLKTPKYTFKANSTDSENRFKLMFKSSEVTVSYESFAYFNGSEWVIENDGEATLQVIDVMGRLLRSETVSGNATTNLPELSAGVYVLRLVNDGSIKAQKIVVE